MKPIKLEDLVKDGWGMKGEFADYLILGKMDQRLLYDAEKEYIITRYSMNKPNITKMEFGLTWD